MALEETTYPFPVTCTADVPAHRVARMMAEHGVGSVVVMDDQERPVGIVTDRDLAIRVVGMERQSAVAVETIMTHQPVTVAAGASGIDAALQMATNGCRRMPVIDPNSGRLVGVVTLDDLLLGSAETLDRLIRILVSERSGDSPSIDIVGARPVRSPR